MLTQNLKNHLFSSLGMYFHAYFSHYSPEVPTKKRVERWAISLEDTVNDPLGTQVSSMLDLSFYIFKRPINWKKNISQIGVLFIYLCDFQNNNNLKLNFLILWKSKILKWCIWSFCKSWFKYFWSRKKYIQNIKSWQLHSKYVLKFMIFL